MNSEFEKMRSAQEVLSLNIDKLLAAKQRVIVAIEGRCGAGKSTLGEFISRKYDCCLIHMDDFFLRPEQRSAERLNTPGENIDHERFLAEVLEPLADGRSFSYRPYSCRNGALGAPVHVAPNKLCVIEGSYSCHPELRKYYDLTVFVTVDKTEQLRRIEQRSGAEFAERFRTVWIPLEEAYFAACKVEESCMLYFET